MRAEKRKGPAISRRAQSVNLSICKSANLQISYFMSGATDRYMPLKKNR